MIILLILLILLYLFISQCKCQHVYIYLIKINSYILNPSSKSIKFTEIFETKYINTNTEC